MSFVPRSIPHSPRIRTCVSLRRPPWHSSKLPSAPTIHAKRCFRTSSINQVEERSPPWSAASSDDVAGSAYWREFKNSYDYPQSNFPFGSRIPLHEIDRKKVVASGFLDRVVVVSKAVTFAHLRAPGGQHEVQLLCLQNPELAKALKSVRPGSAINVRGIIRRKQDPKGTIFDTDLMGQKKTLDSSKVEIQLDSVQCINSLGPDIQISTNDPAFQYSPQDRHLQIRFDRDLARRLKFRSDVTAHVRQLLKDFQEVETPILFKSTPEGAREFLVPTRKRGFAYALPQSPQQYKQILMASGINKYYQFARCFRDEDLRADRQPEFTQIDLEMAWASGQKVMSQIEGIIKSLYEEFASSEVFRGSLLSPHDFLQMPYKSAMAWYGSDKPDLRVEGKIHDITEIVPSELKGMLTDIDMPIFDAWTLRTNASSREVKKFVQMFMDSPDAVPFRENKDGAPGICIYDPRAPLNGLQTFGHEAAEKLEQSWPKWESELEEGDVLIVQARRPEPLSGGSTVLGRLRLAMHKAAVAEGLIEQDPNHYYLWITDFPMFTPDNGTDPGQGGTSGFSATHHPFTAPKTADDVELLLTDPLRATADHYDLVVNGVELGGGSKRIHNADMQKFVMREILKMSKERMNDFSHLFDALSAGCPPHAGFAIGFDRLITVMTGRESVKDVIAFPKSSKGEDMMVRSPSRITDAELSSYHLQLRAGTPKVG